jgi:hypothetical protein
MYTGIGKYGLWNIHQKEFNTGNSHLTAGLDSTNENELLSKILYNFSFHGLTI